MCAAFKSSYILITVCACLLNGKYHIRLQALNSLCGKSVLWYSGTTTATHIWLMKFSEINRKRKLKKWKQNGKLVRKYFIKIKGKIDGRKQIRIFIRK